MKLVCRKWRPLIGALLLFASACEVRRPPQTVKLAAARVSLHEAARNGDLSQLLINRTRGVDLNGRDAEGFTALHWAAREGRTEAADLLIMWGADVDAQDAQGRTAMHWAAAGGHIPIVRLLIAANASVNLSDHAGMTPIRLAQENGRQAVYDLLLAAGAEIDFAPEIELAAEQPAPEVAPLVEAARPVITGGAFRIWTSASSVQLEAEYVGTELDTVLLRDRYNVLYRIPIHRLSRADQIHARELAGTGRAALVRPTAPEREAAPTKVDALGPRFGKLAGWTLLENCRFVPHPGNDGDSFHVRHEGKEHIFRLYYVDAPETSLTFPARVQDQARYFGLAPDKVVEIGHRAAQFTERKLSGRPFTVATCWEDARGQSQLKRYFAFVTTAEGDLDELLVSEGLARIYGMPVETSLGNQKRQNLKRLEQKARHAGRGAWRELTEIARKP